MRIDYAPFFRSTVGFDRLINLLESASEQGLPRPTISSGPMRTITASPWRSPALQRRTWR